MAPLDHRYLARNGALLRRMNVTVTGSDAEAVVFDNGFGTAQPVWAGLPPWLEPRRHVVRFDWPIDPIHFDAARYGRLESFAEDLPAIVAAAGVAPCTLVAHSMSDAGGHLPHLTAPGSVVAVLARVLAP